MDARKYIAIEETLTARLQKTWRPLARRLYRQMLEKVRDADFDGARELLLDLSMEDVAAKNGEFLAFSLRAAAVFGASMVSGHENMLQSGQYTARMKSIAGKVQKAIRYNCTVQTAKAAMQSIAAAEKAYNATQSAQKAAASKRFVREFTSFQSAGDDMLQLISSLNTSRLAVWGFTAEAEMVGVTEYRLSAVLDGRTSEYCRWINGKTFKVADARASIESILSADDPEDLKTLQPWPKKDKVSMAQYKEMTPAELTAKNWHIPPFHPGCRTLLVKVGYEVISIPKTAPAQGSVEHLTVDKDAFGEMSFKVSDRQIDYWNQVIGDSPAAVFSKLSGVPAIDLLSKAVSKSLFFSEDGSIRFRVTSDILGKGSMVRTEQVYDPYTKTMYSNRLQLENADPEKAAPFFKKLYVGMLDTVTAVGGTALAVQTGSLGYVHARMGFVAQDWEDLRDQLSDLLATDLSTEFGLLSSGQRKVVIDLLDSKDPKALTALVNLPFEVENQLFAKRLLANVDFAAMLYVEDVAILGGF